MRFDPFALSILRQARGITSSRDRTFNEPRGNSIPVEGVRRDGGPRARGTNRPHSRTSPLPPSPPLTYRRFPPYSGIHEFAPFHTHRAVRAHCEAGAALGSEIAEGRSEVANVRAEIGTVAASINGLDAWLYRQL